MNCVLLDKNRHNRAAFDCGVPELNNYLQLMAHQHATRNNTRTFVLEDATSPSTIKAFYTLTMCTMDLSALPQALQKKHAHCDSAGLIARLAVDKHYTGQRLGEWMLLDALFKLLQASDMVGFPLVVVDAKQGAKSFYTKYGFREFHHLPNKLFLTMADIRENIGTV